MFVRRLNDFPAFEISNIWDEFAVNPDVVYVGQTHPGIIGRCIQITTDPSDLVLDPTCGSGTTATVAEQSFEHPDAIRRFRLIQDPDELERALDYPWEKWTVFLHPAQRELVKHEYNGPARVSGSAGTGKTIVALHRVVYLARKNPDSRLLLTTFSDPLSNVLGTKLRHLTGNQPRLRERIEIQAMNSIGKRLYESNIGKPQFAGPEIIRPLVKPAAQDTSESRFSIQFLMTEWEQIVDAWQLDTWESYRDVMRLGRKTRLKETQRAVAWSIFERVRSALEAKDLITYSQMFSRLASFYAGKVSVPFDFLVVDEAQDMSIAQLRFLAALGKDRGNGLFFAGDLGQRIFQQPFSWKALGVDIRGRSTTLKINYRTSHQIRMQADRLLGPELADVDGNSEERRTTISLFNGPPPAIQTLDSIEEETKTVSNWLKAITKDGLLPHEIAIFVRSAAEVDRARAAAEAAGLSFKVLDDRVETAHGKASIATMHLAKGLEFRAVVVMACFAATPSRHWSLCSGAASAAATAKGRRAASSGRWAATRSARPQSSASVMCSLLPCGTEARFPFSRLTAPSPRCLCRGA